MKNYNTKYVVRLSVEERGILDAIMRKGRVDAGKRRRAQILLKADAGSEGSGPTDEQVATALDVSARTIHEVRQRYVEQGLTAAIERKPRVRTTSRKLDGEGEARLIALACGPAPEGFARWTLRLLAKKLVELKIVDTISKDAVRETLKKTSLSLG
jgi:transposase